jgi:hypothetical protein
MAKLCVLECDGKVFGCYPTFASAVKVVKQLLEGRSEELSRFETVTSILIKPLKARETSRKRKAEVAAKYCITLQGKEYSFQMKDALSITDFGDPFIWVENTGEPDYMQVECETK